MVRSVVLALVALMSLSCSGTPVDTGGTPCPCKDGFLCVNSLCRPDCRSGGCPGDTECASVGGADLAICLPPGESLGIPMEGPKLPVPVDLVWSIENGAHMYQEKTELAVRFPELLAALGGAGQVAVRTVVVSSKAAGFQMDPAVDWPPSCFETRTRYCLKDKDCEEALGSAGWECKVLPASQAVNLNGSINPFCIFRCNGDFDCCKEFCFFDECGTDQSCAIAKCQDAVGAACFHECRQPGGGPAHSGCLAPPVSADCPTEAPPILEGESLALFRCLAVLEPQQSYAASVDRNLKFLWDSLAPDGPNAQAAAQFLRPDASLSIVFLSGDEDCSIDPDYASPSFACDEDKDCALGEAGATPCRPDPYFSKLAGKEVKLCHGAIKTDYYNQCALLGEFQGVEHHNCAYDLNCIDCRTDADCQEWWACSDDGKCRPGIFGLPNIASYQNPPGSPIFSLAPVGPFREKVLSLKKDPLQVFVAGIVGDGLPLPPDKDGSELPSFISSACLADDRLRACTAFAEAKEGAKPECVSAPASAGCEEYRAVKLACIRECYVASLGDPASPSMSKNTFVSYTDGFGEAQLSLRLIRFIELFGAAGATYPISAPDGIGVALLDIADRLNKRIYRACLPDGYSPDAKVLLLRHLPGDTGDPGGGSPESAADVAGVGVDGTAQSEASNPGELLTQGPDGDYEILPSWYACCPEGQPDCTNPGPAIQFHAMVNAGTTFEVVYLGQ